MALKDKVVNLVIRGKNLFSGTAAEAEDSLDSLGSSTRELKAELDKLENTQKIVKGFGEQRKAVTEAEASYQQGTRAVAEMARELRASEGAGEGLNRQWQEAKAVVAEHAGAIKLQRDALRESGKAQTQAERELKKLNAAYEKGKIEAEDYANEVAQAQQQLAEAKRAHDANRRSLEQSAQASKSAAGEVKQLGAAVKENQRDTRELATQFDRSKRAAAGAKTEFQQQRVALEQSRRAITAMGGSAAQLNQTQQKLTVRQRQLKDAMEQARQAAAKQAASLKDVGDESVKTESQLGSLARTAVGSVAAFFGLSTIAEQIKQMFTVGDKFERLESQVTGLMGSIEAGKEATAWIKEFAKDTPLQLEEVTSIFVKLKAFGLDPMNGTMQAVVDQAYKLGGSFEEVEGISLALGQAWAKQKLQGEEILQLIERGVPVWDLLATVTGKNTLELQKLSSEGKLGRDVIKALMEEMGTQSKGAAATGMTQLSGLISNAKDNLADFYNQVATSGALDWLKGQLTALNAEFKAMSEDGRLKKLAQNISDWLVKAGEAIKSTVATIYEWRDAIIAVAKAWALLKIAGMIRDIGLFAGAMRTKLIARTAEASAKMGTAAASAGRLRMALMLIPGSFQAQAIIAGLGYVAVKGYEAAKSIRELQRQVEAGNNAEANQQKYWRETIKQNEAIMQSLLEYRNVQMLTAEEVAGLNKAELAAYKKKLDQHKEYLGAQLLIKKSHEQLGNTVLASSIKVESGIKLMHQGMQALDEGIKAAAERIEGHANPAIRALVNEFNQAVAEGGKADKVLGKLFKDTDLTVTEDVNELIGTLIELKRIGYISGESISTALGGSLSRLSTHELIIFQKTAADAFQAASGGAAESARVVEAVTGEAYRRLGVSLNEVRTGISDADEQVLGSFKLIASDAKTTATQMEAAFLAAVGRITSEKGMKALEGMWVNITERGRVSTAVSAQHLDTLGKKMVETKLKAADIGSGFAQSKDGVQELIDSLYKMSATGEFTADQMQQHLAAALDKLSGEELARFKAALIDTFNAGESHAFKLAGVVEDVTSAAFKRLGLSLQEIRTGIDETGADVLAAFDVIAADVNSTSAEISAAFKAAAGRLDTEKELQLLREAFIKAAQQAGMSWEEMSRGLAWLDEDIKKTAEHVKAIGDGYDTAAMAAEKSAQRQMKAQRNVQSELGRTRLAMDDLDSGGDGRKTRREKKREELRKAGELMAQRQQADLERRTELLGNNNGAGETVTIRFEGPGGGSELTGSKDQVEKMILLLKQQGLRTS